MTATGEERPWIDYEWAVIRVVPQVHREQFVNVGILFHARQEHALEGRIAENWKGRVTSLAGNLDLNRLSRHLETYLAICRGDESAGPVALLPPSERFHWLTHPRSGVVQTSARHPGRTRDVDDAILRLLTEQCA